jgi:hypothetical protein
MKTIEINITDEQFAKIQEIMKTRADRSQKEIVALIMERGIFALAYRTKYNKVRYARLKDEMEEFKAFKAAAKSALSGVSEIVAAPKSE